MMSLMVRPYCFFSKVELSICLYSVRFAALSWVRRVSDFFPYELFRGGSSEISVIIGAIPDRVDISLDCVWIFVVAECSVDGLFPGVCECPDVVKCM